MKKLVLNVMAAVLTVLGLSTAVLAVPSVYADGDTNPAGQYLGDGDSGGIRPSGVKTELMTTVKDVINIIIGIIGMLAVIMMIIGGINFVISQGDAAKVTKAKNTVLYGVVGLVVALLAFAIVNFVLTNVFGN